MRAHSCFLLPPSPTPTPTMCCPPPASRATCSRRNFLLSLPFLLSPISVSAAAAAVPAPSAEVDARSQVQGDLSLDEFVARVETGQVLGVWFYGSVAEYCAFQTADGKFWHVGEGYPTEDPRSNQSPLQLMARVRNLGVPYFVGSPVDVQFLKKR